MRNPRVLLAAGVVAVAVVAGVAALTLGGGGSGGGASAPEQRPTRTVRGKLTLELFTRPDSGTRELLVSLPGPQFNVADFVRGTPVVWLRCTDAAGRIVIRSPHDWPLVEEVGFPPHIHEPAGRQALRDIRRCRLTAPGIDFAGAATAGAPAGG